MDALAGVSEAQTLADAAAAKAAKEAELAEKKAREAKAAAAAANYIPGISPKPAECKPKKKKKPKAPAGPPPEVAAPLLAVLDLSGNACSLRACASLARFVKITPRTPPLL